MRPTRSSLILSPRQELVAASSIRLDVVAKLSQAVKLAGRLARAAPALSLHDAASACGVRLGPVVAGLGSLPARGRCAEIAAAAVTSDEALTQRWSLAQHRVCPPSAVRAFDHVARSELHSQTRAGEQIRTWPRMPDGGPLGQPRRWGLTCGDAGQSVAFEALASKSSCPASAIRSMAATGDGDALRVVAQSSQCPPGVLVRMAAGRRDIPTLRRCRPMVPSTGSGDADGRGLQQGAGSRRRQPALQRRDVGPPR